MLGETNIPEIGDAEVLVKSKDVRITMFTARRSNDPVQLKEHRSTYAATCSRQGCVLILPPVPRHPDHARQIPF